MLASRWRRLRRCWRRAATGARGLRWAFSGRWRPARWAPWAALAILVAFQARGAPIVVMPLVFGLAPVIHTLVLLLMARSFKEVSWPMLAGIALVALGAAGLLINQPSTSTVRIVEANDGGIVVEEAAKSETGGENKQSWSAESPAKLRETSARAYHLYERWRRATFGQWMQMLACIVLAALCWGAYGPMLYHGQMRMQGSDLRPLLCVGAAYFAVAVVAPSLMSFGGFWQDGGRWTAGGAFWALLGGAAAAAGALGVILAFQAGGRPPVVMPLVFGGAPLVNTLATLQVEPGMDRLGQGFLISLVLLIGGAVTVLAFAPRHPKHKQAAETKDSPKARPTPKTPLPPTSPAPESAAADKEGADDEHD